MTTTRYFEVTFKNITDCGGCPYGDGDHEYCKYAGNFNAYFENKDQLTDSCPMAAQHKTEGEVLQNIRNLENDPYERI